MTDTRFLHFAALFPDRDRRKMIWGIALPIMGGMMSQNVLNLVDIGMVGHLGDTALAATGIGGFTNYLAISFIIGLSAGVQALAARRLGEGRDFRNRDPSQWRTAAGTDDRHAAVHRADVVHSLCL